jgi:hypothetical protein
MSESGAGDPPEPDGASLHELARDWITLWQSELTGLTADREARETWQAMVALWAGAAGAMLNRGPTASRQGDEADRRAGSAAASRPAPAAAAPDPRDAEIERLVGRVAKLEQRLIELERAELERAELERRGDRRRRRSG